MSQLSPRLRPFDDRSWKASPARARLLDAYRQVDGLASEITCDTSTDCCHFERTGREPYLTAGEYAEVRLAIRARGLPKDVAPKEVKGARRLPLAEGRCPLLQTDGACRIYASRPFGCRTFFCSRSTATLPRKEVQALLHEIVAVSEQSFEDGQVSRSLRSWMDLGRER